jgi:two-component system response regulator PilR (NtrC family)
MNQPLALVIDDEPDICELLTLTLGRMDIRTETAMDVSGAKTLLGKHDFDICLTDMRLPDGDGLELVEWMQANATGVPVAVITAHGNVETAVQALKLGAFDFISKPLDLGNLRTIVEKALRVRTPGQNGGSKRSSRDDQQSGPVTGTGAHFRRVRHGQGAGRSPDS